MLTQEESDEVINQIKSYLEERSINFAFAILDEDGDLRYDYSNWRVGKMLFADSLIDMSQEMMMLDNAIWSDVEDEDEED
jgi:hypothetical protein